MIKDILLNLVSIMLGLIAWAIPIVCFAKKTYKSIFTIASFSACAFSICFVIYAIKNLVIKSDWSSLMDTAPAYALVSTILIVVTIVLNLILLILKPKK